MRKTNRSKNIQRNGKNGYTFYNIFFALSLIEYKILSSDLSCTGGFVLFHVVSSPVKRDLKGKWTIRERGTAYACLNVTFLHRDKKRKFSKSDLIRRDYKRKSLYLFPL